MDAVFPKLEALGDAIGFFCYATPFALLALAASILRSKQDGR